MLAGDTETCLIRRGLKVPPLVCVSWALPDGGGSGVVGYRDAHDLCKMMLEGESLWANAAYDLAVIGNEFPDLIPLIFDALADDRVDDVIIRQRLIDIAQGCYYKFYRNAKGPVKILYAVKDLAQRLLGITMKKDEWRLKYGTLREIPVPQWPQGAIDYSRFDSEVLLPIWTHQEQYAFPHSGGKPSYLLDRYRQVRASMALHLCSAWGMRTSRDIVQALDDRTAAEFNELRKHLWSVNLLHNKGSRNTKRAKEILLSKSPWERLKLTATGEKKVARGDLTRNDALAGGYVSLDEESCESSGHPDLVKYARFSSVIKLRSTFVNSMWNGVKYPLQPNFLIMVETGRTSCSNPNLQQLPREPGIRECCVPREGCVFLACDYDKAELVSLAESCLEFVGFSRLGDRLLAGFDPHLDMGAQILGITYDEAVQWKKIGGGVVRDLEKQIGDFDFPAKPQGSSRLEVQAIIDHLRVRYNVLLTLDQATWLKRLDDIKTFRQMAKAANFGLPGGLGAETFVEYAKSNYGVVITLGEAKHLKYQWNLMWPEMKDYFRYINTLMDAGIGHITQPYSKRVRGHVSYTQMCNSFFQQRTADGAKAAAWEVTRRQFTVPSSALYGTHMVNFVHDELINEVPEAICHEAGIELREVMIHEFSKFHPKLAKAVRATPVAMNYWSKKAEPVYDDQKRLIPWGEKRFLAAA